jgi:penicillin-binding protein 1A
MEGTNKRNRKYLIWFWTLFSMPFIIAAVLFILISKEKLGPMPSFEELENPEENLAAEVYADDGVLLGKFYVQNRTWTEYNEISPHVVDALIATEDIRFSRHSGIDIRGLGRVIFKTVILGQNTGGGSTITQQLAKNLFPRDMSDDSKIVRTLKLGVSKFKEWQTAVKLERSYTKEEIITMYLNIFDFIYNAVGIRSAAQIYFNTTPDSLNIQQSATLVGMLKNSARYNPKRDSSQMLMRRNVVLIQMAKYGYLTMHVADSVKQLPIKVDFQDVSQNTGPAQYLREYIRTTMISMEPERKMFFDRSQYKEALWQWQNNPLYGWCRKNKKADGSNYNIYKDGLKIYTTINSHMQKYAEDALAEHLSGEIQPDFNITARSLRNPPYSDDLSDEQVNDIMMTSIKRTDRYRSLKNAGMPEDSIMIKFNTKVKMRVFSWKGDRDTIMTPLDSLWYYKNVVRSSFMAMDPHTGYVKAYVGGPDFRYFKYDAVTQQKRQVGSTIKPFLYTLAMQDGFSPCYEVENVPRSFDMGEGKEPYIPKSSGPEEYHGKSVTLRWGLAQSENYISAWVIKQFTPTPVVDLMHRMGIRDTIDPVPSIFLGTSDITLEEMVGAYGTFANKGVYTTPIYVTRIEDRNGNAISRFAPMIEEVISENDAYLMLDMLQGVVKSGTGIRLRNTYQLMNQIGGKTGTTQNHGNGWFMGITPNLVGGVWAGWEDQSIHFPYINEGQGANMALPTFGLFLQKLYLDPQFSSMVEDEFEKPTGFNMELDCAKVKQENIRRDNFYQEKY